MGMIFVRERSGKTKRKPGWRQAEAEHQAWLDRVSSMTSGLGVVRAVKPDRAPPKMLTDTCDGLHPIHAARYVRDVGTKPVARPEHRYAESPELLARELQALERRFNSAPMYNKSGPQFVSEDELRTVLATNRRRP